MKASRMWSRALYASVLLASAAGCHLVYPGRRPDGPMPCVPGDVPRELSKVSLPDYIIEPPDVLSIEAVSLIPKQPYELHPLDAVAITTQGLPEKLNLAGEF